MNVKKISICITILFLLLFGAAGCDVLTGNQTQGLSASGLVEAVEVEVASESAGRVAEVTVAEGDEVQAGDLLITLEDEMIQSQRESAAAGLKAAQAARNTSEQGVKSAEAGLSLAQAQLDSANAGLDLARLQEQQTMNAARAAAASQRAASWSQDQPADFELPPWYFDKAEQIQAARDALSEAESTLENERTGYMTVIEAPENSNLADAEERLVEAQAAFRVADDLLAEAKGADDNQQLEDYAQAVFDAAQQELEAAQSVYDQLLTEETGSEIMEARARWMAAQERYDLALDRLNSLLTGEDSFEVQAAALGVTQAEAAVAQAEAGLQQAQANLDQLRSSLEQLDAQVNQARAELQLLDVQLGKLALHAPVSGVVLNRLVQPGELLQPGVTALTLGELNELTVTVYIPEDRYGQISLGDQVEVTADSFPGQVFSAQVTRIADQAEFTPRNVQTEEERRTTVFAVELSLGNEAAGKLKPGMPVDVNFGL